jgi:hypothetical protein
VIVDHFDLHLLRAGILLENASQRFLQIIRSRIEGRDHYRPKRAAIVGRQYADCGRFETAGGMRPF